jgi:hypothetical protein
MTEHTEQPLYNERRERETGKTAHRANRHR